MFKSAKVGNRGLVNPRGFSFISFLQLCMLLIVAMIAFLGSLLYHSYEWDPSSPENFVPSNVVKERNKVERNKEDVDWVIGKIQYAIDHPIPELHTGLKRYGSISDTNFSTAFSTVNRDKFKKSKSEVQTGMVYNVTQVDGQSKPKQKMIKYDDWVDEPEALPNN